MAKHWLKDAPDNTTTKAIQSLLSSFNPRESNREDLKQFIISELSYPPEALDTLTWQGVHQLFVSQKARDWAARHLGRVLTKPALDKTNPPVEVGAPDVTNNDGLILRFLTDKRRRFSRNEISEHVNRDAKTLRERYEPLKRIGYIEENDSGLAITVSGAAYLESIRDTIHDD